MAGSDDDKASKKINQVIKLPVRAAKSSLNELKGEGVSLGGRARISTGSQPWHGMPKTIIVISSTCIFLIAASCIVALYKVCVGSETSFAAYTLAGTCVVVCGIILAAFFGKNSKSGLMGTN